MKQDGRKLDHRTLEVIRKMAMRRVREGEKASEVMASYGFSRSVIYRWLEAANGRRKGLRALASRRGTGRPRKLTAGQERQVFRGINGKNPRQYRLDGGCGPVRSCVS
jgi:transposase